MLEPAHWLWKVNYAHPSPTLHLETQTGRLKLAMVGIFTWWKLANATNLGFLYAPPPPPKESLVKFTSIPLDKR